MYAVQKTPQNTAKDFKTRKNPYFPRQKKSVKFSEVMIFVNFDLVFVKKKIDEKN